MSNSALTSLTIYIIILIILGFTNGWEASLMFLIGSIVLMLSYISIYFFWEWVTYKGNR